MSRLEAILLWLIVVALLVLVSGCACEAKLQHWLEFKNQQLTNEAPR